MVERPTQLGRGYQGGSQGPYPGGNQGGYPGGGLPVVLAQDPTGRRWAVTHSGTSVLESTMWWSDDHGATWDSQRHLGDVAYTDHTIAFLADRTILVSTDRGQTWQEHGLPDLLRKVKDPKPRRHGWGVDWSPTASGTLLAVVGRHLGEREEIPTPGLLFRSTDRTWTRFVRVGTTPRSNLTVNENTLAGCNQSTCSFTRDLGKTWHTYNLPE